MLKLYRAEENAEPVEIGMAERVRFRGESDNVGSLYELNESNAPDGLHLYGMKTSIFAFPNSAFRSQEVANRDLIIAALVNMMGGAVTIQPHEIDDVRMKTLVNMQQQDPFMLVVKLEN